MDCLPWALGLWISLVRSYNPSMDLDFGHEAFKFQGPRPHRLAMCHVGGLQVYFAGPKGHANASGHKSILLDDCDDCDLCSSWSKFPMISNLIKFMSQKNANWFHTLQHPHPPRIFRCLQGVRRTTAAAPRIEETCTYNYINTNTSGL